MRVRRSRLATTPSALRHRRVDLRGVGSPVAMSSSIRCPIDKTGLNVRRWQSGPGGPRSIAAWCRALRFVPARPAELSPTPPRSRGWDGPPLAQQSAVNAGPSGHNLPPTTQPGGGCLEIGGPPPLRTFGVRADDPVLHL